MQLNKNINRNLLKEQSFPSYNINNNEDCILHFGIGNFHRAHQALYIHEILENNKNISIIGVNLRSEETNNKMQLQDYLYSLVRISNNYKKVDILNPIKKVLFGLKHKNEIRNLIVSEKINLITNNPNKVKKLNDEGLEVMKIIKLKIEPNEINKEYLNTKKIKSNHIFD